MTTAERLRTEGRAEGRAEALVDLLSDKFGPVPTEVVTRITAADTTQLRIWMRASLNATSLDEVFTETSLRETEK